MFKYFWTSGVILILSLMMSMAYAYICFKLYTRPGTPNNPSQSVSNSRGMLPSILLLPMLIWCAYHLLSINLFFPIDSQDNLGRVFIAAIVPATVLLVTTGLASQIKQLVKAEYEHWSKQVFCQVIQATGRSFQKNVRFLIINRSLGQSWSQCLPWVFSELIIIEIIFGAPGLGLEAWHLAKVRDFSGLATNLITFTVLYLTCHILVFQWQGWVGKKLESYL